MKKKCIIVLIIVMTLNLSLYRQFTDLSATFQEKDTKILPFPPEDKLVPTSDQLRRGEIPKGSVRNNLGLNFITSYHINPIDPNWDMVADPIPVLVNITSPVSLNVTAYQDFENITVVLEDEVRPPLGDTSNFLELVNESIPSEYNIGPMSAKESKIVTWYFYALKYYSNNPTRLMTVVGKNTDAENVTTVLFPRYIEMQLVQIYAPKMVISGTFSPYNQVVEVEHKLNYNQTTSFLFNISSIGLTSISGVTINITNTNPEFLEIISVSDSTTWNLSGIVEVSNSTETYFQGKIEEIPPNNHTIFNFSLIPLDRGFTKVPLMITIGHNLTSVHNYNYTLLLTLEDEETGLEGIGDFFGNIAIYFIAGIGAFGIGALLAIVYGQIRKKS